MYVLPHDYYDCTTSCRANTVAKLQSRGKYPRRNSEGSPTGQFQLSADRRNRSESRACNYYNGRSARQCNLIWSILPLNDDDDCNDERGVIIIVWSVEKYRVIYRVYCCVSTRFRREIGRSASGHFLPSSITRGTCGGLRIKHPRFHFIVSLIPHRYCRRRTSRRTWRYC